jgi:pyruvate dehydrogenase E2 component (dihydrolipoamide acetyltransferase)
MPADVIMPALGMAQETGKVLRWLKSEGDAVSKGEPLLEIETDKVTVEIESPAEGTLGAISAAEGDEVPVGQVVAVVLGAGESAPDPEPRVTREVEAVAAAPSGDGARTAERTSGPRARGRTLASPKARRIARERGVDVGALTGSGPRGAVVAADIDAAVAQPAPGESPGRIWRVMAERTTESWQTVPHFYLRREVDATRLLSWRVAARERPGCEDVSVTDLLVKVTAEALRRNPRVQMRWSDGMLIESDRVNVAVAVATDAGLTAPVIHDADRLDLPAIVARRKEIVEAANASRLQLADLADGTFTISNLGMYGVDEFDAIVNAPQSAILAVGRIVERVVPADGRAELRPTVKLSLSFDHRAVDGARGANFLDTLASLLEEPAGLVR